MGIRRRSLVWVLVGACLPVCFAASPAAQGTIQRGWGAFPPIVTFGTGTDALLFTPIADSPTFFGSPATTGMVALRGVQAGEYAGLVGYPSGTALAFKNSQKTFEIWGDNGTALQPVMTWVANATNGFVSIRKPDDSRGMSLSYPSASNPTITVEVPAGTNNAGADLDIGGGPGTGSGTPGKLRIMAATAGSSGTTQQTLSNIAQFGGSDIQFYLPFRLGASNVAGTGTFRLSHASTMFFRNSANDGNFSALDMGSATANVLTIGDTTASGLTLTGSVGTLKLTTIVAPAASGTRYLCISTTGVVSSSASACSGT